MPDVDVIITPQGSPRTSFMCLIKGLRGAGAIFLIAVGIFFLLSYFHSLSLSCSVERKHGILCGSPLN